ncbi:MAG: hypothetical protein ACRENX_01765 [Candidatus Dormibacteria bacterium]
MSGGAALTVSDPPPDRHLLIPFASTWRRTQIMLFYGAGVLLIGCLVEYLGHHRKNDLEFLILGLLLLLIGVGFHFGSRLHYVQVTQDGLRLNRLLKHELVPYSEISQVRCQLLEVLFAAPSRRGLLLRSLRQFQRTPACVIRLKTAPAEVKRLGRAVGRGCAIEQDLILLVKGAQALEHDLQPRIRRRPPAPASRRR